MDFVLTLKDQSPVETGPTLSTVLPLVVNGGSLDGMEVRNLQTDEIRVGNTGDCSSQAEVRFFSNGAQGGPALLAATQTADVPPGGVWTLFATDMPSAFVGWVGVWSSRSKETGDGCDPPNLTATATLVAPDIDGTPEMIHGIARSEIHPPMIDSSLPVVYKNYGGTDHKWSSMLVVDNLGEQTSVAFRLRSINAVASPLSCRISCTIMRSASRGGLVTLNLGDFNDPEIALLPDGTFTVDVFARGWASFAGFDDALASRGVSGMPGGHVALAINVNRAGDMMTVGSSRLRLMGANTDWLGQNVTERPGPLYVPFVFNNSDGWNAGIAIVAATDRGNEFPVATVSFYHEDGVFLGDVTSTLSNAAPARYIYLPALAFLPDNFRGAAVIEFDGPADLPTPESLYGTSFAASVFHVNYELRAAMSYDPSR